LGTDLRSATTLIASTDTCAVIMGYQRPWATVGHLADGRYELDVRCRLEGGDEVFGSGVAGLSTGQEMWEE
jgi:hypothetical protein